MTTFCGRIVAMRESAKRMIRIGCVAAATLPGLFTAAASGQSQSDQLIVANERIGAVRLGDTAAQVIDALGQPQRSGFLGSGEGYLDYPGLMLTIDPSQGVQDILICQPRYQHRGRVGRRWCY